MNTDILTLKPKQIPQQVWISKSFRPVFVMSSDTSFRLLLKSSAFFIVQEELLWINQPISYYRFGSSMSRSQRGLEESQGRVSLMPGLTWIPSLLGMVPSSNLPWAEFQLGLRIF